MVPSDVYVSRKLYNSGEVVTLEVTGNITLASLAAVAATYEVPPTATIEPYCLCDAYQGGFATRYIEVSWKRE